MSCYCILLWENVFIWNKKEDIIKIILKELYVTMSYLVILKLKCKFNILLLSFYLSTWRIKTLIIYLCNPVDDSYNNNLNDYISWTLWIALTYFIPHYRIKFILRKAFCDLSILNVATIRELTTLLANILRSYSVVLFYFTLLLLMYSR